MLRAVAFCTRACVKFKSSSTVVVTNGDTPAKDVLDGECGEATTESEVTEQRREEVPTSTLQELNPLEANADTMRQWQATDPTLAKACDMAKNDESDDRVGFYYNSGLLYRKWRPEGSTDGDVRTCKQLGLPQRCRQAVSQLAHDVRMAGHMGLRTVFCRGTTGQESSLMQQTTVDHLRYAKKVTLNVLLRLR